MDCVWSCNPFCSTSCSSHPCPCCVFLLDSVISLLHVRSLVLSISSLAARDADGIVYCWSLIFHVLNFAFRSVFKKKRKKIKVLVSVFLALPQYLMWIFFIAKVIFQDIYCWGTSNRKPYRTTEVVYCCSVTCKETFYMESDITVFMKACIINETIVINEKAEL